MIYEFTPTQDLHGYDEPWAPGANVNLIDEETLVQGGIDNSTGLDYDTLQERQIRTSEYFPVDPETTYTIAGYCSVEIGQTFVYYYDESENFLSVESKASSYLLYTFTTPEDAACIRVKLYAYSNITPGVVSNLQMVLGSEVPVYTPYANICPPKGYNIWDPVDEEMIPLYSGYVDANANKLYLHPVYEEYDGEELVGPWMSSMDKYTEDGTPTTGAFVVDFGGDVTEYDITDFMLQTLLDSLGVRRFITSGAMLLNSLMDQAQGRVRSEEELLNRSLPLHVIAIGEDLPTNLVIRKPISDVLPGLPGKIKI